MSGMSKSKRITGFTASAAIALTLASSAGAFAADSQSTTAAELTKSRLQGADVVSTVARSVRVAEAAAVAPDCTYKGYAPNKIVLGASPVTKTFSVASADCDVLYWAVALAPFLNASATTGYADSEIPTISLNPRKLTNADAGKHANAAVYLYGTEDPLVEGFVPAGGEGLALTLQRASTFGSSLNASEPVKKGKSVKIVGKLGRINWNGAKTLKYGGLAKVKVAVQFQASGSTTWKTMKTVTTATGGKISTTYKQSKSGSWRLSYAGASTTAPSVSKSDAVKVTD